jgi:chemotaxis methyl-accepting protein methylase
VVSLKKSKSLTKAEIKIICDLLESLLEVERSSEEKDYLLDATEENKNIVISAMTKSNTEFFREVDIAEILVEKDEIITSTEVILEHLIHRCKNICGN